MLAYKLKYIVLKILVGVLILLIVSSICALVLTILGKYFFDILDDSRHFISYIFYYTICIFILQIISGFWLIFCLVHIKALKKVNLLFTAIILGFFSMGAMQIASNLRLAAYYFEPWKHQYQIISFFSIGFSYPFVAKYLFSTLATTK